jgi:hypothetical protein
MRCFAAGSRQLMEITEGQLKRNGYREVQGPVIGVMQYCRIPIRSLLKEWTFNLLWEEPAAGMP